MCAQHEKEWWVRHHEALAQHAADPIYVYITYSKANLDLIGG
jgi:hypothetical protein